MGNLRRHLWAEWTGLAGSSWGLHGKGWHQALGDLVSPCTAAVTQEQFQASPVVSLIFNGPFSKGL